MAGKKASKKQRSAKPKSFRERFNFWLDLNKQVEYDLADAIHQLKRTRQFASTIRDGLRLILTLRLEDTSVIESLFPNVVKKLVDKHTNNELSDLRRELSELRDRVATATVVAPAAASGMGGLQKGVGKSIALNLDDDDDAVPAFKPTVRKLEHQDVSDTLVIKKAESSNGETIMKSMMQFFD